MIGALTAIAAGGAGHSSPSAYWYLARGTGAASLILLTASVVLGILGPLRFAARRWPRFAVDTLHRDVSLLVLVLLVAHIATSVLDSFAPIRLSDGLIPFISSYRALWMGLGTLAFDLLIALVVTSLLRRRLGYGAWRAVHWLAYASWPVAVLHGLGTGTDVKVWWMLALTVGCTAAVMAAVIVRISRAVPMRAGLRISLVVLALVTPLGMAVFALAGPLQRGWARRAGTPATLLAKTLASSASSTRTPVTGAPRSAPFSAALTGSVKQTPAPGGAIVDLALRLGGAHHGRLRIRIAGAPIDGGGLSMTGSQVVLAASGIPSVLQGRIVALNGQSFVARVAGPTGVVLDLRADLNISSPAGPVSGRLSATPAGSGGA